MATSSLVVGIDLGGTNMQIGVVDAQNRIVGREGRKTKAEEGKTEVIKRIVRGVEKACEDAKVAIKDLAAVGIAAPGAIDIPRGVVLDAPNLKWRNAPLRDLLQKRLSCPVVVDNDVNGAVWGESVLGAGRGRGDLLGVWMGTGVGGGLVINGKLFYGEFFTAGEVGQTVLFPNGEKGRRTVEDFCSRTGISRTIQDHLKKHPKSILHEITAGTGQITGSKQLAKAYTQRDALAVSVVDESADLLGIAIANWITVLAIDTVIIGGGVTEALGSPYLSRIRKSFKKHVFPARCQKCRLIMTKLKDDAGLLGAALLARAGIRSIAPGAHPKRRASR
jgi:glucokinase